MLRRHAAGSTGPSSAHSFTGAGSTGSAKTTGPSSAHSFTRAGTAGPTRTTGSPSGHSFTRAGTAGSTSSTAAHSFGCAHSAAHRAHFFGRSGGKLEGDPVAGFQTVGLRVIGRNDARGIAVAQKAQSVGRRSVREREFQLRVSRTERDLGVQPVQDRGAAASQRGAGRIHVKHFVSLSVGQGAHPESGRLDRRAGMKRNHDLRQAGDFVRLHRGVRRGFKFGVGLREEVFGSLAVRHFLNFLQNLIVGHAPVHVEPEIFVFGRFEVLVNDVVRRERHRSASARSHADVSELGKPEHSGKIDHARHGVLEEFRVRGRSGNLEFDRVAEVQSAVLAQFGRDDARPRRRAGGQRFQGFFPRAFEEPEVQHRVLPVRFYRVEAEDHDGGAHRPALFHPFARPLVQIGLGHRDFHELVGFDPRHGTDPCGRVVGRDLVVHAHQSERDRAVLNDEAVKHRAGPDQDRRVKPQTERHDQGGHERADLIPGELVFQETTVKPAEKRENRRADLFGHGDRPRENEEETRPETERSERSEQNAARRFLHRDENDQRHHAEQNDAQQRRDAEVLEREPAGLADHRLDRRDERRTNGRDDGRGHGSRERAKERDENIRAGKREENPRALFGKGEVLQQNPAGEHPEQPAQNPEQGAFQKDGKGDLEARQAQRAEHRQVARPFRHVHIKRGENDQNRRHDDDPHRGPRLGENRVHRLLLVLLVLERHRVGLLDLGLFERLSKEFFRGGKKVFRRLALFQLHENEIGAAGIPADPVLVGQRNVNRLGRKSDSGGGPRTAQAFHARAVFWRLAGSSGSGSLRSILSSRPTPTARSSFRLRPTSRAGPGLRSSIFGSGRGHTKSLAETEGGHAAIPAGSSGSGTSRLDHHRGLLERSDHREFRLAGLGFHRQRVADLHVAFSPFARAAQKGLRGGGTHDALAGFLEPAAFLQRVRRGFCPVDPGEFRRAFERGRLVNDAVERDFRRGLAGLIQPFHAVEFFQPGDLFVRKPVVAEHDGGVLAEGFFHDVALHQGVQVEAPDEPDHEAADRRDRQDGESKPDFAVDQVPKAEFQKHFHFKPPLRNSGRRIRRRSGRAGSSRPGA